MTTDRLFSRGRRLLLIAAALLAAVALPTWLLFGGGQFHATKTSSGSMYARRRWCTG